MANFNKVLLMGNLTRDPEVRTTPAGLKIAKFGLAVNRRYRGRDEEIKEETVFVDIDAFGNQAETIERYCRKGSPLFVEGRLRLDQWETSTGEKRSRLIVHLENFQFVGAPPQGGAEEGRSANSAGSQAATRPEGGAPAKRKDADINDEDVPF